MNNAAPTNQPSYAPVGMTIAMVLAASVLAGLLVFLVSGSIPPVWRSFVVGLVAAVAALATIVIFNLIYRRPR